MPLSEDLDELATKLADDIVEPIRSAWTNALVGAAKSVTDVWADPLVQRTKSLVLAFQHYRSSVEGKLSLVAHDEAVKEVFVAAQQLARDLFEAASALTKAKDFKGSSDKDTIDQARTQLDLARVALTGWYEAFLRLDATVIDPSLTFIDMIESELALQGFPAGLHEVTKDNQVRLIDTPGVWGRPMSEDGVGKLAAAAVRSLADAVYFLVGRASFKVDILSLNPASGVFLDAITAALVDLATNVVSMDTRVIVRFLFGWVPTRDTVAAFTKSLAQLCKTEKFPMDRMTILIGQYYSYKDTYWNHAKIVAVDEGRALVGGHNLWDAAYGGYPPVHDASILLHGKAAKSAHAFAEFLWREAGEYLVVTQIDGKYAAITLDPGKSRNAITLPTEFELGDSSQRTLSRKVVDPFEVGTWKQGRMLSLGRAGGLAKSTYNASDVAKQLLIRHARRTLRICQQDLLFLGAAKPEAHLVCQWIVDALIDNGSLIVQIVVSPIDASGAGDQYSWGSGAVGTFAFLRKLVETRVGSQAATPVLRRLCVAPLAFTLDVPGKQESVDYRWPEVPKKVWAGRFGTSVPVPSVTTYPPAPGNHSKVFMVDDRAYLIGSDNLYPHNLAEFSYLVEGPAVEEFKTAYWDEVWSFSEELCVSNCCAAHRQVEEIDEIFEL